MVNLPDHSRTIRNMLVILTIVVTFAVLREVSELLIPLALAGLLTILDLPAVNFLEKKKVPRPLITILVAAITLVVLVLVVNLITGTVEQLIADIDTLAAQFNRKVEAAVTWIGTTIPALDVESVRAEVDGLLSPGQITSTVVPILGSLVAQVGSPFFLFLIYYIILLSGATGYKRWVGYVVGNDPDGRARSVWDQTEESISTYMGIKTLISLGTGIISWLVCTAFGLQFALFWGFLAFLLNYIPSIGSLVAVIIPSLMAIIQFESVGLIIGFVVALAAVQVTIGSILDPMIMGNRLRLNTVTVIFGLLFWGYIWGIPGMLLSVPLMVMVRLLLERSEDLAIVARFMGNARGADHKAGGFRARVLPFGAGRRRSVRRSNDGSDDHADSAPNT